MRDDEQTRWNDPAYKRLRFVVEEGTRIGWPEDEVIFQIDDRPTHSFTLRELRKLVHDWTAQLEEWDRADAEFEATELYEDYLDELERERREAERSCPAEPEAAVSAHPAVDAAVDRAGSRPREARDEAVS